jgi:hypothetical protein
MRARDIVGKRVVRVLQQRVSDGRGGWFVDFQGIELEDGTHLQVRTVETETGEYGHRATTFRRPPAAESA